MVSRKNRGNRYTRANACIQVFFVHCAQTLVYKCFPHRAQTLVYKCFAHREQTLADKYFFFAPRSNACIQAYKLVHACIHVILCTSANAFTLMPPAASPNNIESGPKMAGIHGKHLVLGGFRSTRIFYGNAIWSKILK